MLKRLHDLGISTNDYKYLPMVEEFENMKKKGLKTTYIVAVLSEKYDICERKVYKVLRHFHADCHFRTT